jgi:hypothetical protein
MQPCAPSRTRCIRHPRGEPADSIAISTDAPARAPRFVAVRSRLVHGRQRGQDTQRIRGFGHIMDTQYRCATLRGEHGQGNTTRQARLDVTTREFSNEGLAG